MIGERLAQRLAGLTCPDCGTVQPIYTRAGMKSRIRPAHHAEPCANCGAVLHMVPQPGGPFREGLGWGVAAVILFALAVVGKGIDLTFPPLFLAVFFVAMMAGLYVFALVATGLIMGWTRMMVKP